MAVPFKIKSGLQIGSSTSKVVNSITDSSNFTYDSSGLATVNAIKNYVEYNDKWVVDSSNLTPANSEYGIETGTIEITPDSGVVSLVNMSVTDSPSSGTEESYSFDLDGSTILKIYSESDGAGNIQNMRTDIVYDLSVGGDLYLAGLSEASTNKILYYNTTTHRITYADGSVAGGGISGDYVSKTGDTMTGILVMDASIMPSADSTISIGSSTNRFKEIYADEVFVGAQSLYVNNKQVISDISDTITISTDLNQDLLIKTTGSGDSKIESANGILLNVTGDGTSKDIELKTESTSGSIILSALGDSAQLISNSYGNTSFNSGADIILDASNFITLNTLLRYNTVQTYNNDRQVPDKGYVDSVNSSKLNNTTDTLTGDLTVTNNITLGNTLSVDGSILTNNIQRLNSGTGEYLNIDGLKIEYNTLRGDNGFLRFDANVDQGVLGNYPNSIWINSNNDSGGISLTTGIDGSIGIGSVNVNIGASNADIRLIGIARYDNAYVYSTLLDIPDVSYLNWKIDSCVGSINSAEWGNITGTLSDQTDISTALDNKLENTTDTFTGVLTVDGSLVINGDIIQDGSSYETHAEQLYTEKDFIIMREGAVAALPDGSISGLKIIKPDNITNVLMGVGNDAVMRVGWEDDILQAIATREDSPNDGYYAYWDDSSTMFKTYDLQSDIDTSLGDIWTELENLDTSINNLNYWTLDGSSLKPSDSTVNIELNSIDLGTNPGDVAIVDCLITPTEIIQSYSFNMDGSSLLSIYGVSDAINEGLVETAVVVKASYQYIGNPATDGSWRFGIDANGDLKFEKRVSGTWTYGGKFSV